MKRRSINLSFLEILGNLGSILLGDLNALTAMEYSTTIMVQALGLIKSQSLQLV